MSKEFDRTVLEIDVAREIERISGFCHEQLRRMRRGGFVIGLSGGIDSAVSAALCAEAVGPDHVLGLILPEKDSNPLSASLAEKLARKLKIRSELLDITHILEAFGTYRKRDDVVKSVFPGHEPDFKIRMTLPSDLLSNDAYNFFRLHMKDRDGNTQTKRLNTDQLRGIVAATDSKQRTRMMCLYYYAERFNDLVCGTTNRTEMIQGYFVKFGDGGVDLEPLAHLYKTQVYQLAGALPVIPEIIERPPSPDTFSDPVSDEEFYFRIPYETLDLLLFAWEHGVGIPRVCHSMGLTEDQVRRAFQDFTNKHRMSEHLRQTPPMMDAKEDPR